MANPDGLAPVRQAACCRLTDAIGRQPVLLAGRGRLCTALIEAVVGRVYPKNGAEGVYAVGALLGELGLWSVLPAALEDFCRVSIRNIRKVLVGHVESALGSPVP